MKLNDRMHKELTRKKARLEQVQSEKDHLQKAVVLLKERLDNLHLVVSEKDIMLADATREAEDLRRQVEVLDRAVKGYLKKDSRPSSRSVHPTFGDERKEGKDSIRSKKVLRFAEPVISNSPHQQRLSTRDHRHLGGSSHWTDVTEDQFAETQAIYERLRQVAKVCVYVCTYIHIYVCTYIHTYVHTYVHATNVHMYIYIYMYVYTYIRMLRNFLTYR